MLCHVSCHVMFILYGTYSYVRYLTKLIDHLHVMYKISKNLRSFEIS